MRDEVILRMLRDARESLADARFPVDVSHVVPAYNALLAAVKANHPQEAYLQALSAIEGGAGPEELRVLFGQLSILLEAWLEADMPADTTTRPLATPNPTMKL